MVPIENIVPMTFIARNLFIGHKGWIRVGDLDDGAKVSPRKPWRRLAQVIDYALTQTLANVESSIVRRPAAANSPLRRYVSMHYFETHFVLRGKQSRKMKCVLRD